MSGAIGAPIAPPWRRKHRSTRARGANVMIERSRSKVLVVAFSFAAMGGVGCNGDNARVNDGQTSWEALISDGDPTRIAPGSMRPMPPPAPPPGRFCPSGDCSGSPLALWAFDDCGPSSTTLADTAFASPLGHPAFRAVSAACVPGIAGAAVKLADDEDRSEEHTAE